MDRRETLQVVSAGVRVGRIAGRHAVAPQINSNAIITVNRIVGDAILRTWGKLYRRRIGILTRPRRTFFRSWHDRHARAFVMGDRVAVSGRRITNHVARRILDPDTSSQIAAVAAGKDVEPQAVADNPVVVTVSKDEPGFGKADDRKPLHNAIAPHDDQTVSLVRIDPQNAAIQLDLPHGGQRIRRGGCSRLREAIDDRGLGDGGKRGGDAD